MIPEGFHPYVRSKGLDPRDMVDVGILESEGVHTLYLYTAQGEEHAFPLAQGERVYTAPRPTLT